MNLYGEKADQLDLVYVKSLEHLMPLSEIFQEAVI
jgi:hypothetical protein